MPLLFHSQLKIALWSLGHVVTFVNITQLFSYFNVIDIGAILAYAISASIRNPES